MTGHFTGAKGAIVAGGAVVALLRDDRAGLPWRGWWDLPGGGREGDETAWHCFARETFEETGLELDPHEVRWRRSFRGASGRVVFFGVVRPALKKGDLRLGREGQAVTLMPTGRFVRHPRAIPALRARLAAFRAQRLGARGDSR